MDELQVQTKGGLTLAQEWLDFINALRAEPPKEAIKINEFNDNSKYLPISFVEDQLDYFFGGIWETKDFEYSVIVNEIACKIQLRVYHPHARIWIERTGTSAVQIQLRAEYETVNGQRKKKAVDVLDVSKKIVNTVQKDLPHAKAEAIKNAAKSLGQLFGRNLNRAIDDAAKESQAEIMTLEDAEIKISSTENKAELNALYASIPKAMKADKRIKTAFLKHQDFLKTKI